MQYKYTKIYKFNTFTELHAQTDSDETWLTEQFGYSNNGEGLWNCMYVSGTGRTLHRLYRFKRAEDHALFVLTRG